MDKGPFRVVQDGWEHAKLSPLSPRTEIFPGSQNSKPTGEALSECDAGGGGPLTIYGAVTLPAGAGARAASRCECAASLRNTHSLHFSSCLGPPIRGEFDFFNDMEEHAAGCDHRNIMRNKKKKKRINK